MTTRGMLLGKFMPPHRGHQFLVDFARHYVDELIVVVGSLPDEPIPGQLRHQWMTAMFPQCKVVHLEKVLPQDPSQHPQFWELWRESLLPLLDQGVDYVFASEAYGQRLAQELSARYIPVDPGRMAVPISASQIRSNPRDHWHQLPQLVRPYFQRRICVFGPESTGKTTLCRDLAEHYGSLAVPEYARAYLEAQDCKLEEADLVAIARGQWATEQALAPSAGFFLFLDTDILLTTVWSQFLYGRVDPRVQGLAQASLSALYVLTDVDVPWEADPIRYLPEERKSFQKCCQETLIAAGCKYVAVSGTRQERVAQVITAIEAPSDSTQS